MTAVIEISGLRKSFRSLRRGARTALDGFDMTVEPGQMHGFLGPNGSGKTTTLRTLLGLVSADSGEMRILGTPSDQRWSVAHRPAGIHEMRTLTRDLAASGVTVLRLTQARRDASAERANVVAYREKCIRAQAPDTRQA